MNFKLSKISFLVGLSGTFLLYSTSSFANQWGVANNVDYSKPTISAWGEPVIEKMPTEYKDRPSAENGFMNNKQMFDYKKQEPNLRKIAVQDNSALLQQRMKEMSDRNGSNAQLPTLIANKQNQQWQQTFNEINEYNDEYKPKYSDEEISAGKALMCLLAGDIVKECQADVKKYFKKLFNPKKHGSAAKFLRMAPPRSSKGKALQEKYSRALENSTGMKSAGWTNSYEGKRIESFMKHYDVDTPAAFHWKNKHSKFLGVINIDGERFPNHVYTCDLDTQTGLNTKIETRVEKYKDDNRMKEKYYLKTLTEMPDKCIAKKYHFPISTVLPYYDHKKCDANKWYRAEDYMRGYELVEKPGSRRYGRNSDKAVEYIEVPIEKDCWVMPVDEAERLKQWHLAEQQKIIDEALKTKEHPDITNAKLFNLTVPNKFKIPQEVMFQIAKQRPVGPNPFAIKNPTKDEPFKMGKETTKERGGKGNYLNQGLIDKVADSWQPPLHKKGLAEVKPKDVSNTPLGVAGNAFGVEMDMDKKKKPSN